MNAHAELVIRGVAARLARILPVNAYETDAGARVFVGLETVDENQIVPALSVYMDQEQPTTEGRPGCPDFQNAGSFYVGFWVGPVEVQGPLGSATYTDTLSPLFPVLRDLKRALFSLQQPAGDALQAAGVDLVPTRAGLTPRGDDGYFSEGVVEFTAEWNEAVPPSA